ncbi:hypothetical protein B0H11DRAFT_2019479 [Mycena galericulata]|nr:hypothetical protein B0H11DRAFT_2019479 [Mycena galericulata]
MCIPDRPTGARPTHPRLYTRRTHARPFVPVFVCVTSSPVLGAAHRGRPLNARAGCDGPGACASRPRWYIGGSARRGDVLYMRCVATYLLCLQIFLLVYSLSLSWFWAVLCGWLSWNGLLDCDSYYLLRILHTVYSMFRYLLTHSLYLSVLT